MDKQAMQNLKTGQRVQFSDGVEGRVTSVNKFAIGVDWADGQSGYISTEDGRQITVVEEKEKVNDIQHSIS